MNAGQQPRIAALSDLGVTEFLTLGRLNFKPRGLVVGTAIYEADTRSAGPTVDLFGALFSGKPFVNTMPTGEITLLSEAVRAARTLSIERMRQQATSLHAEGVVGVRLEVEHHLWRGGHQIVKFLAMGTAIGPDMHHPLEEVKDAPSLKLKNGQPFTSDLSGTDFVALLQAGYRPVTVAGGTCIYQLNLNDMQRYQGYNAEIAEYTRAFFDARETAMARLQYDLFSWWPPGHPDAPTGIVGMTVSEEAHRPQLMGAGRSANRAGSVTSGASSPVVEFTAIGTAVAPLAPNDPRRAKEVVKPLVVVPLDR
jgi:uncharacterized protein YbjQ (UPF0145 family)